MIRRIDDLGRVVIPKELRQQLQLSEGDALDIVVDKGQIVIKKEKFPVGRITMRNGDMVGYNIERITMRMQGEPCINIINTKLILDIADYAKDLVGEHKRYTLEKATSMAIKHFLLEKLAEYEDKEEQEVKNEL